MKKAVLKQAAILMAALPLSVVAADTDQLTTLQQDVKALKQQVLEQAKSLKLLESTQKQDYQTLEDRIAMLEKAERSSVTGKHLISTEPAANAFESAMKFVENKDFAKAESALSAFLISYPNDVHVPQAHYELAVAYKELNDLNKAISELKLLRTNFKTSGYYIKATLMLAQIQQSLGDNESAKKLFQELVINYPKTDAGTTAQSELNELQKTDG